jgi:uncharacterized membrane protein
MATGVAEIGREIGLSDAEIVGTAMLTLTVATTLVGIMTWLVGGFSGLRFCCLGAAVLML